MVHSPQRTSLSGPALVRLLARLSEAEVQASSQSLADRLSQWLGWTDAIALSTVLSAPATASAVTNGARTNGEDEAQRCLSLRSTLSKAIALDGVLAPAKARRTGAYGHARALQPAPVPQAPVTDETDTDYAVFRQCYVALQQKMESDIGDLRGRLRSRLAAVSPAMAKLATLDAIMERSLAARERALLGAVPGLLGAHFERLRKVAREAAAREAQAASGDAPDAESASHAGDVQVQPAEGTATAQAAARAAPGAWLDAFRKDVQSVLLAELDVRFQPVEGLLAALRAH
ncbi:hypothetical protein LMG28688_07071 [Paraburkholderia caffeinitolerans]|uniref:DUF3348 domain-containing protein n=1 Tax=Paraburkholderia caffeinitolerans TaxID=1723730 RepID=A0A6J5H6J1_9BURK|nr:DUF3348 domain-containing protein [Paraburkholderia caffeinitolerans]CAB3809846.1 hypothetical protein LMG28688_07071 [Paraburkholderia caffeinitolerans]